MPGALARPGCRGWVRAVARAPLPTCLLAALCCCQNHLTFALYNHTAIWASKPEVRAGGACAPTPAWAQGMPRAPCCVVLAAGNAVQRPPAPECREDEQVHGCAEGGRMPVGQRCSPSDDDTSRVLRVAGAAPQATLRRWLRLCKSTAAMPCVSPWPTPVRLQSPCKRACEHAGCLPLHACTPSPPSPLPRRRRRHGRRQL